MSDVSEVCADENALSLANHSTKQFIIITILIIIISNNIWRKMNTQFDNAKSLFKRKL